MVFTLFIVGRGIRRGIERAIKIMMPGLFVLILVLTVYSLIVGDAAQALSFLFTPDFGRIDGSTTLIALGQALLTLSVGGAGMIVYGAYLSDEASIPRSGAVIALADTAAAIVAGLVIFPLVFAYGLTPGEGPGLIFVTLPIAFGQMPGGIVFGLMFFLLMLMATLTSALSMFEPVVAWLEDTRGVPRKWGAVLAGFVAWFIGLATVFSFNVWSEVRPLAILARFEDMNIFDSLDFAVTGVFLPIGAFLVSPLRVGGSAKRCGAKNTVCGPPCTGSGSSWSDSSCRQAWSWCSCSRLVRDCVTVTARVGARESILGERIDHHCRGASGHSERTQSAHLVSPGLQFVVNRIWNRDLDSQPVEAGGVWPERTVEMLGLRSRPLECGMQIRIPVIPELYNAEKSLQYCLLLIVASRSPQSHHGSSFLKTRVGVSVYRGRARGRIWFARVLSSQNCSPRTLMPIPVSPRITAPPIQPPLGVESKMFPSLSMIAMCVVSFMTPAESCPSDAIASPERAALSAEAFSISALQ